VSNDGQGCLASIQSSYKEPELHTQIRPRVGLPTPSKQVLRVSNAIREELDELDAVGAGFLALWLVLTVVATFALLAYFAIS
jgi:hypothetical protein